MEDNLAEEWRKVPGFENYEVSNLGRVKNINFQGTGRTKHRNIIKVNASGYYKLIMCVNGKRHHMVVHQVVAMAFINNPNGKPFINHKNGIKTDNRVSNLEWSTPKENMEHAFSTGLCKTVGDRHSQAKLTNRQVHRIKCFLKNKHFRQVDLSKKFHASLCTINHISTGHQWRTVL